MSDADLSAAGKAALEVAASGLPVFPCNREKRPLVENGFKAATTDPKQVRRWWSRHRAALIGVPCGLPDTFDVVDLDKPKEGQPHDGEAFIREHYPEALEAAEIVVRSQSGGLHLYFAPGTDGLKNRAGRLPGVDTRASGGYVCVPGSGGYRFERGDWNHLLALSALDGKLGRVLTRDPDPDRKKRENLRPAATAEQIRRYAPRARKAFITEVQAVRECASGSRNDRLNLAAFNLGTLIACGSLRQQEVEDALTEAALACGLDKTEIPATIASGIGSGLDEPRDLSALLADRDTDQVVADLCDNCVFVIEGERVANLEKPPHLCLTRISEFRGEKANERVEIDVAAPTQKDPDRTKIKMVPSHELWFTDERRLTAQGEMYHPARGRTVVDDHELLWINSYWAPSWPQEADPPPDDWLELCALLAPDEADRELLMRWAAHTVWRPEVRSPITPLLITPEQGVGKGTFSRILEALVGPHNVSRPKMPTLLKQEYHDYVWGTTMCVVDEVNEGMEGKVRYSAMDTLRDVLTEPRMRVNIKYRSGSSEQIFTNFLMLSNHRDALVVNEDDRRLFVVISEERARGPAFYERLRRMETQEEPLSRIAASLYPLSLEPLPGRAPMSASKMEMVQSTRPDWYEPLREALAEKGGTWTWDAITASPILSGTRPNSLKHAMAEFGWTSKRFRCPDGERRVLWWSRDGEPDLENFHDEGKF
ncbi:MAG: bifunctional DNA primase/polymerase [Pseudomonadota bacterium]